MKESVKTVLKLRSWVHVAHHIPGRIRLKYKLGIIAHLARFNTNDITRALDSIPAFKTYKLNSSTSSILIEYDQSLVDPALLDNIFADDASIAEKACFELADRLNLNGAE